VSFISEIKICGYFDATAVAQYCLQNFNYIFIRYLVTKSAVMKLEFGAINMVEMAQKSRSSDFSKMFGRG